MQIPTTQGQKCDLPKVGLDPVQTCLDPDGHHKTTTDLRIGGLGAQGDDLNDRKSNQSTTEALTAATHCMRSTPTKAMEVIFGLPPIDLFLQEVAMKTWLRIQPLLNPNWDGVGDKGTVVGHQARWGKQLHKIQTISLPRDNITPVPNWTHFDEVLDPDVVVYTDGSKMDSKC